MSDQVNWEVLNTCVFCGHKFPPNTHYYFDHGTRMEKYFMRNFPKQSKLSHKTIPFKSIESYYLQDFIDRKEMQDYIKSLDLAGQKEYCTDIMKRRLEVKQKMFLPSQVETLSLMLPSAKFYNKIFGDYYKFGRSLGIDSRFKHLAPDESFNVQEDIVIQIDTREQQNFKFKQYRKQIGKLDYGDYKIISPDCGNAVIERKGITDFISSFGSNRDRVLREFDRAKDDGGYIYVLVEENLHNALRFNSLPNVSRKIRATPDFVFKNVRDIMQSYTNVQFLFLDNRSEMERVIPFVLTNHKIFKDIDIQLYFDSLG